MTYDGIIFDLDGTLWRATPVVAQAWTDALHEAGLTNWQINSKDIEAVAGRPYNECVDILLPGIRETNPTLIAQIHQKEKEYIYSRGGELYMGVREGIQRLAERTKIYIISNCQTWYLDIFLEKSGIGNYFRATDCHGNSDMSKKDMIIQMVKRHKLNNPVYVGDRQWDEVAADEAGIPFIHVTYGFGNATNPMQHYDTFQEFIDGIL